MQGLLMIDMQKAFDNSSWGERNNPQLEVNSQKLLNFFREKGWPVLHVQHLSLIHILSIPSTDVFDAQDQAYKEEVLPNAVRRRVAIEMAASLPWYKYVGLDGAVIGIDTFGASAPAAKIIEEYGFTVENVVGTVKGMN